MTTIIGKRAHQTHRGGTPKSRRSTPPATATAGGDASSAKQVLRAAALSGDGRVRLGTPGTQNAHESKAVTTLTGSADTISAEDIALFSGISGYSADGTPTWGELATALAS